MIDETDSEPEAAAEHQESPESLVTDDFFPVVYDELRRLARNQLGNHANSLSPTGLVHEAFFRLVAPGSRECWDTRGHFFSAAANAMRQIIVDRVRRRKALKRGGDRIQLNIEMGNIGLPADRLNSQTILDVHEALDKFAADYPDEAKLVEMRYFGGLGFAEAARALNISESTARRKWEFARAIIMRHLMD